MYSALRLSLYLCPFSRVSNRGLQAGVGHVAAHRHILAVLAGVKRNRFVATICDRPLPARTLHAVHVDGTGACNGSMWRDSGLM